MKWKPTNKEELYRIVEEIVTNQNSINIFKKYHYGLKDIETSLITDMGELFSCYEKHENYKINRKIDWNDPRNNISLWNISQVTI